MMLKRMCGGQDPINSSPDKLAIKGYDPVTYFTEGKLVKGYPNLRQEWMGAIWRFSSKKNRELFIADPEKYSPQYGGYCAYGISLGKFFSGDPSLWTVKEGKLYLQLNQDIEKIWKENVQSYIKKADIEWPKLMA
ncbi:MAG: YHS domain protein [Nitrospirota bacterium]|nr:MAG: YHS domain protein [Nitrospirota bacterium]